MRSKSLPLFGLALLPALAVAQSAPQSGQLPGQTAGPAAPASVPTGQAFVPNARLSVPRDNATVPSDNGMRTALAVVNGDVLTDTDVEQRLRLTLLANGNPQLPAEEVGRLRAQVLRNLVDESLQIQAANADKLDVEEAGVNQRYAAFAQQFGRTPRQMSDYLASVGSSEATLKRQIRAETAWQKVLGRRVGYFVNVSDEEVNAVLDRLKASKGQTEYRVGEIFLSTPAGSEAQAKQTAEKIMEQLRAGGSFTVYARQFSEASTAAVGGDLGWVRPEQLPPELAAVATDLNPGQVTGPIAVPGGLSILLLIDKRQILIADPRKARLALRQVSLNFPAGTSEETARPLIERFGQQMSTVTTCDAASSVAAQMKAEVIDNDQITASDLPPQIADTLLNLEVGHATPVFGSPTEGVRVLVLCGREAPQAASLPSFDQMKNSLENQRIDQSGRRVLRDLRRDAVIEYR